VRTVTLHIVLLVLVSGLLHATWNAIAKSYHDQWTSFALNNLGVLVPSLIALPFVGLPRMAVWWYLGCSTICHLGYQVFLMAAYRHGTLSRSYPIARGVAPALTSVLALIVAGERLSGFALVGVALIVGGIVSLALADRGATTARAVGWALATGVAIALYTLVDGLGVRASHDPLRYTVALFVVQTVIFLVFVWRSGRWPRGLRVSRWTLGLSGGVVSLVAYGIVLYAQTKSPLGVVSALRETGVIWAALIGILFFKEKGGWRVGLAALVVVGGVAVLAAT
jgi:drug/metabolite transporter (DMT)-like permease